MTFRRQRDSNYDSATQSVTSGAATCLRTRTSASSYALSSSGKMLRGRVQLGVALGVLVVLTLVATEVACSPTPQQKPLQQQQQPAVAAASQPAAGLTGGRAKQCREGCIEKFSTKELLCRQNAECSTCWEECVKPPPPKINKSIRETWSLHTVAMLQQDSLVLVDVAWTPLSTPNQCLVTWEVSGGGLMGNLLTESFNVQLSLWPDTKYRVQVTCKHKITNAMSRSLPLSIDTADAAMAPQDYSAFHRETSSLNAVAAAVTTFMPAKLLPAASASGNNNELPNSITAGNANGGGGGDEASVLAASAERDNDASVLPYDDDQLSAESISQQHTNFIFNWHTRNGDISAIEPLHKPDLNILSVAALSELRKPLVFGVVAGTLLLTIVLLAYVCVVRQHGPPADKASLIEDAVHSAVVSMPPGAVGVGAAAASSAAATSAEVCKHSPMCTRNALKV